MGSVVPHGVEEVSAADGCTQSLGGMKTPGALVEASECCPQGECPGVCGGECECPRVCGCECGPCVCGVAVRVHHCVKTRAATHTCRECKGVCKSALVCE